MWKAAFTGRSERGEENGNRKPGKEEPRRKKSSHSHRAESVISSSSRRDDDRDRERRKSGRGSSAYENGASRHETASSYTSSGPSQYGTAPTSRVGAPRPLTESALRMLPDDEEEWEDDDKDARSERRSKKRGSGDEKRRKSTRSEKDRSRSRSQDRKDKRKDSKESKTSEKTRDKEKHRPRRDTELVTESSRAIPESGSFAQFPGQYAGGYMGPSDPAMMSGALPSSAPQQQFPGQDPYVRPSMPPSMPSRSDSYGHAAEYYLDEGQSVQHQPGFRTATPNMLVNPDLHLVAASAEANPAQDTGHGAAADFYSGQVSSAPNAQFPSTAPSTPAKPSRIGKVSASAPSSSSKPRPSRSSSAGAAVAALAAGAGVAALSGSSHQHSQSQQVTTSSSTFQQGGGYASKPNKSNRHSSDGSAYYQAASSHSTYPPTLASSNGHGPYPPTNVGTSGRHSTNSNTNTPIYAAAAAGAAGLAAHEYSHHHQHISYENSSYGMASTGGFGRGQGPPRPPQVGLSGSYYGPPQGNGGGMAQMPFHEHKGPMTRLKDGLLNIISTPEDVAKMEMYTEYIGVCKYCFDPRTSAWDAPRVHHYHKRRDSFESLRRRRSGDRLGRKGSDDSLRRQSSIRVDKDSRYYASESSRRKRDSGGVGVLGAGIATVGGLAAANALRSDRKDFDDTYSVKSGHRESSAVRRRSRSSSRERRRRSQFGIVRPDRDEFVTVRRKDGTIERRRLSRKSRSSSRERKTSGLLGAAAAGAALGATGITAGSRHRSRSRSHSSQVTNASDTNSRRTGRHSPSQSSYYDISRHDRAQESQGIFGGFFSPRQEKHKRRNSREHQKKRKGFFTFSNSSSSSSNSDIAFGDGFASRTSLPLSRKSSAASRSGRRPAGKASRKRSDDHLAATVAGIGATAAALAAAQRGGRITKRTSRPELGKRRDVRQSHADSSDEEWEDELPSDSDDASSVEGGLAYGEVGRHITGRQSMESMASQSSAGGLGAWGWRWGGKDRKRPSRRSSPPRSAYPQSNTGGFGAPGLAGIVAGPGASAIYDASRPVRADQPVYLDDTGRRLPSVDSTSVTSGPQGPLQFVDPAPISEAGTPSRYSIPGAFDEGIPVSRPGPGPIQAPQPISPAHPSFASSPHGMDSTSYQRPNQPRRANSSPTRCSFAQDAALIGGAALATAGALAGMSSMSGRSGRDKDPSSRVSFGLTNEQQEKEDRERRREQKAADEERRRADRTRALKEEADRVAKESRQEDVRRQREEENRRAAEARLQQERLAQREAEDRAERERQKDQARREREHLEQEAKERQEAAIAAAAEVERLRKAREEAQKRAESIERERYEREEAYAREQARYAAEAQRRHESEALNQNDQYSQRHPSQSPDQERRQWPSARRQSDHTGNQSPESEHKHSSSWAPVAVGAAAAATVGAVMAGHKREQERDSKSRENDYYDEAHQDRPEQRYGSVRGADQKNASYQDADSRADFERRASEKYGRSKAGVEVHDEYAAAEVKPKNEHEGEPLMDDDIYDPDFFKKKHSPSDNARYAEFARRAADKVVNDREHAYDDDKRTTYAEFFAPKELLAKEPEGKTRAVSPNGDMDMQVYHERNAEMRSHFPDGSDYGSGVGKHAPHGVPRLNVIAPTPPPSSVDSSPLRSREQKKSPLSQEQVQELSDELNKSTVSQSRAEKSERSRSISWGDDRTHYYNVDTPDSHHDRDSWISSPDVRGEHTAPAVANIANATIAGAALHEIVVEETDGTERRYTEEDWLRQEETDSRAGAQDDDLDVEDITPTPEPEPQGFYRQPFFDSVSDMGTAVFGLDSPGTEGAPPIRGFVEGETDEPTPTEEKQPHIPGGFDDEVDEIDRAPSKRDDNLAATEDWREQAAAAVAGAAEEVGAWQPRLSKKDKKKREKEAKRAGSVADSIVASEPSTYFTAEPELFEEPAQELPLSKKEQKTRDKEAKRRSNTLNSGSPTPAPVAEAPRDADELFWEPSPSAKDKKKRDKASKQAVSIAESGPFTPDNESEVLASPATQMPPEPEEDYFLSKKDKKKREKARKQSGDLASSAEEVSSEIGPVDLGASRPPREPLADDRMSIPNEKEQEKRDKGHLGDAVFVVGEAGSAAAVPNSTEDSALGSGKKKKKGKKAKLGEPSYDDPRDLPVDLPAAPEPPVSEPYGMPGGWDSDRRDSSEHLEDQITVDPFQFRLPEEGSKAVERDTPAEEDWASWGSTSKKSKKKGKRNSAAFNLPEVSSPLRTEVPFDDYVASKHVEDEQTPHSNGRDSEHESPHSQQGASIKEEKQIDDNFVSESDYFNVSRHGSDSPKQISRDDSRSVVSAPEDRKSRREAVRRNSDYADEPSYAYETASVAATEPVGEYDRSRNSKRRSKHADDGDDSRSVIPSRSRSRREKEESPSDKKKEKKGGLFGLFSRKSTDDVTSYKDESSLSRTSTRESKRDAEDDESRHRRKHRSRSDYGDDDDTRSAKSGSSKSRRHRSGKGSDDESKVRRRRSTRDEHDDHASPARSEPGHRHHRRRGTEDDGSSLSRRESRDSRGGTSEIGHRHHHRRRTDEDTYGAASRDQSFLGMRVEDLPPLPVSRPVTPDLAAAQQRKGSSAEAESGTGLVSGAAIAAGLGAIVSATAAAHEKHEESEHIVQQRTQDQVLDTPRSSLDAPSRPVSMGRPPSSSAVPLHFPGRAPQTPANIKDRSHSFSSSAVRSPATPSSSASVRSRQGRPQSTEIRPLYLVERNRQTPVPEIEDALPSLPSSKPSSRASSVHGGDEGFQSALEEFDPQLPEVSRAGTFALDMDAAAAYKDEPGSGEVTPKASDFHSLPVSAERGPKQEPQFYTWEDFAQDERLHGQEARSEGEPFRATTESTKQHEMPRNRSQSPVKGTSAFKSAAAAAMLGTAAVYAHHKSRQRSAERVADTAKNASAPAAKHNYPLPAPVEEAGKIEPSLEQAPILTRESSSKNQEGDEGKNPALQDDATEAFASNAPGEITNEPVTEIVASAPAHIDLGRARVQSIESLDTTEHRRETTEYTAAKKADSSPSDRHDEDASNDAKADAGEGATSINNNPFLPSSAAHSQPITTYSQDFFASREVESGGTTSGSGSGVPTPFMAVPTPADNFARFLHNEENMEDGTPESPERQDTDADRSMQEERKMQDGSETPAELLVSPNACEQDQQTSKSYKIPTAKAELAPAVVEQRNFAAVEPHLTEVRPVAQLTRKQTKKGRKKGKTAMLWEEEPAESIAQQSLHLDTELKAESSARGTSTVDEPLTAIEQTKEDNLPGFTFTTPVFGTADFNTIALGTSSAWQNAQAQVFHDSMLANVAGGSADTTQDTSSAREIEPQEEEQWPQPTPSEKESEEDKKQSTPALPAEVAQTLSEPAASQESDGNGSSRGIVIAAGLGAAAAAIGIGESLDQRSRKKKAKRDKKKQADSWAEDEVQSPALPQSDNSTPAEIERSLNYAQDTGIIDTRGPDGHATSSDEPEVVIAPDSNLENVAAQSVDALADHKTPTKPDMEDASSYMVNKAPQAAQEDFFPTTTNNKGKKNNKKSSETATLEPEPQALEDAVAPQMSFSDSTFVGAADSQTRTDDHAAPPSAGQSGAELTEISASTLTEQVIEQDHPVEDPYAPVSRKQSKKDKKKKKAAAWSEPESVATAELSRRESVDDAAFVDASEGQTLETNVIDGKGIREEDLATRLPAVEAQDTVVPAEIAQPEESTAQEDPGYSEPRSNRKSKKDKKKKTFDWTTFDDPARSAATPDNSVPDDRPESLSAVNDQSEQPKIDEPVLPRGQDSNVTAEPVFHETTILPTIDLKDFDLGPVGATDTSAVDVSAVPPTDSQPIAQEAAAADHAVDELAPVWITEKGKKEKKQQSLDRDDLYDGSSEAASHAEQRALSDKAIEGSAMPSGEVTELNAPNNIGETSFDSYGQTQDVHQVGEANDKSETPLDAQELAQDVPEVLEASTDDFAPTTSSKKSKKDKKKKKQSVVDRSDPEPESETPTTVLGSRDVQKPAAVDSLEDVPSLIDSLPQDNLEATTAQDVTPAEEVRHDSVPAIPTKKSKDKKKKKSSALEWDTPEFEATAPDKESPDDLTEIGPNVEAGQQVVDPAAESALTAQIEEVPETMDAISEEPKDAFASSSTAKKSKKDKKKKKSSAFDCDTPESEATTPLAEYRADLPQFGLSAEADPVVQTEQEAQMAGTALEDSKDDFMPASTSKKSKKEKKKKKSAMSWDEPGLEATTPTLESRDELLQPEAPQRSEVPESLPSFGVAVPIEAGSEEVEAATPQFEDKIASAASSANSEKDYEGQKSEFSWDEAVFESNNPSSGSRDELAGPEASTISGQTPDTSASHPANEIIAPIGVTSDEIDTVIPGSEDKSAAAAFSKKLKKEKKRKKSGLNWDEPEPEPTGASSVSRDELTESAPVTQVEGREAAETNLDTSVDAKDNPRAPDTTNNQQVEVSPSANSGYDDYTPATSSKQSKKDKKKKKKQASSWDDLEPNSEAALQPAYRNEQTSEHAPDTFDNLSAADPSQITFQPQDESPHLQTDTKPEDDDVAAVSTKKSKKDKKNKKQLIGWEEPGAESEPVPPPEAVEGSPTGQTSRDTRDAEPASEGANSAGEDITADQPEATPTADEVASNSTKKGKKDKKKKRQAFSWDEPEPERVEDTTGQDAPVAQHDAVLPAEQTEKDLATSAANFENLPTAVDTAAPWPGTEHPAEQTGLKSLEQEEVDLGTSADNLETEPAVLGPESALEPTAEAVTEPLVEAPIEDESRPTLSRKQSKKDKKKKLQQNLEDLAPDQDAFPAGGDKDVQQKVLAKDGDGDLLLKEAAAETLSVDPSEKKPGLSYAEPSAATDNVHFSGNTEPLVEAPIDEEFKPELSRKQSKKDKKRKLQQSLRELEPDQSEQDTSISGLDETMPAPKVFEPSLGLLQVEPAEETVEDAASQIEAETAPSVSVHEPRSREEDIEIEASSSKTQSEHALGREATLQEQPEDDWGTAEVSKKDKKGRKGRQNKHETPAQLLGGDEADKDHDAKESEQPVTQSWDDTVAAEQMVLPSAPESLEAMPREEPLPRDDFAWSSSSKKRGKKGKNARASLPATPPIAEEVPSSGGQQMDDVAALDDIAPETATPRGDKSSAQTPSAEKENDFSWAPSSKKKGKKSKKKQSTDLEPFNDDAPELLETAATRPLVPATPELEPAAAVDEETLRDESPPADEGQTAFEPADVEPVEDDAWDAPVISKKKSKEDKKELPSGAATPIEELRDTPGGLDQVSSEQDPTSLSQFESINESFPNDDTQEKAVGSVAAVDGQMKAETKQPEQQQQEDFSWTSSSKKKGKKGKRSKQPGFEVPSAEAIQPLESAELMDRVHGISQAGSNESEVDGLLRAQIAPVVHEPTVGPADDLWAASTSKNKKGKKSKKKASGTATPVTEPAEPISEVPSVMQEYSDVLGQTSEAMPVVSESVGTDDVDAQQSPENQRDVSFVSDQPANAPASYSQEAPELPSQFPTEPSVILEPAATLEDDTPPAEPAVEESEDFWAVPTTIKKNGKKGKKRDSDLPPPVQSEPLVSSVEQEQAADDHATARLADNEAKDDMDDADMMHDMALAHGDQDAEPANATFDDVWAEEDIATSEDYGAVQDLFEENAEDARSSWIPGSKKSKKKKGKKGSVSAVAAANSGPEPLSESHAIFSEPANMAGTETPLPVTTDVTEKSAIAQEEPTNVSTQQEPSTEREYSHQVDELPSQNNLSESMHNEPNADATADVSLWNPQSNKKKGKKNKKGNSVDMVGTGAIVPSSDDVEDLTAAEEISKDLFKPVDESEQRPEEIHQGPANDESDAVYDDWSAPQSGKKKGKRGSKVKQALAWEDQPPVEIPAAQEVQSVSAVTNTIPDTEASKDISPENLEDTSVDLILPALTNADEADALDHAATNDNTSEQIQPTPAEGGSDEFFTVTKAKKDKKKAKNRKGFSAAPWVEPFESGRADQQIESEQAVDCGHSASLAAASAATAALAGVVAHEVFDKHPEEDNLASVPPEKSKQDKKRATKSGSATPSTSLDEAPVSTDVDVKDFAPPAEEESRDPVVNSSYRRQQEGLHDNQESTEARDLSPESSRREQDTAYDMDESAHGNAAKHETLANDDTRDTTASPAQDIDFTATVAAGLADSGFDPNLVINDPVFQRRASPPGVIAEADPGEVFTTATKKKSNKNKKSPGISDNPEPAPMILAEEAPSDNVSRDYFNDAITQSLQGTGFDPALLDKALTSSNEPSSKEVTEDPEEFSFTTTKRKKGKKGIRSHAEVADTEPAQTADDSLATNAFETQDGHANDTSHALTRDLQDSQQETLAAVPIDVPEQQKSHAADVDMAKAPSRHDDQRQINILSVGHDEMDMEEMDRQYKEYKRNKRKQKKLKAASRTAGLSDNPESATEHSAMVSESEGLSTTNTRDNIISSQTTLDATTRQLLGVNQAATETDLQSVPDTKSAPGPIAAQSIFGERVKRRIPPKPKPEQDPRSSLDAPIEPRPEFGTAGMAAVVAAAARERQVRKESAKSASESARQEPSWQFDKLQDTSHAMPESPVLGSKVHQPIRDSGYEEATRSPNRANRASREVPQIVHTSSSRDSLRRSLEPLHIPTSPENTWDIQNPKKRGDHRDRKQDKQRLTSEESSTTPSAETPLKPTSKDRASYLFQSPPGSSADTTEGAVRGVDALTPQPSDSQGYFRAASPRSSASRPQTEASQAQESGATFSPNREATPDSGREHSVFSPGHGPLSPRLALDAIPEDRPTSKRGHSSSDIGGPDHIKAVKRTSSPQGNNSQEQALSSSVRPSITIPLTVPRSVSNPLSTDQLINRLSWPSVDEEHDTVNIDRHLGHRHSRPALPDPRSPSVLSNPSNTSGQHFKSPQELRSYSRTSNRSSTPSLRRTSLSGDLRAVSRRGEGSTTGSAVGARDSPKTIPFEAPPTPPPNDDELMTGSASRAVDMNDDVFQGYGDAQQSQVSPTRPPSVRKRQSMHITDLESQLGQLTAENRALREAREYADQTNDAARDVNGQALREALEARDQQLQEKDHEIGAIKAMLQPLREEVARLIEINGGLTEANRNLVDDTNGRYATLQAEHAHAHEQWQSAARDLEGMRHEHGRITSGMKDIVEAEIATALADKNAEILRLREQLDIAAEQIRALQVQIQSSKSSDFLAQRDEDYFDGSCQKLCQHVQQWVLRFSKLSDNRICRLSTDLNDEKIEARLDNAVLDGSDVDKLLGDRVRRRDVFMSVVMTMVWEYVFTRYLFGMDREQRQKLKALEKLLAEVGPPRAVSHWRATTLTLLAKRPSFEKQCTLDTEAVCHEIFGVLCSLLPPPSSSQQQLLTSLQKVIRVAVDLSIEMRTQRAEYIMLPPLQPEYDTNGDLVRKVHFNASLMNERSGFFSSNEELAAEHAVVKIVLFPLVVKKGDDYGEGEEEIVVCPAQVLVQNDGGRGKKVVRVMSGAMEIDDPIRSRQSKHSLVSETPGSVGF